MMILKSKVKLKIKSVQRWMNTLQIFLKGLVMPSLKDLKNRIESVKNTRKITKLCRWLQPQNCVVLKILQKQPDPILRGLILFGALASANNKDSGGPQLLVGTGKDQTHLLIVMTAERGLCGGFNSTLRS